MPLALLLLSWHFTCPPFSIFHFPMPLFAISHRRAAAKENPLAISHRLKQSRAWFLSFRLASFHDYILLHDNLLSSPCFPLSFGGLPPFTLSSSFPPFFCFLFFWWQLLILPVLAGCKFLLFPLFFHQILVYLPCRKRGDSQWLFWRFGN